MSADHATRALSFGAQAATYDATRPSYPDSVLDQLAAWAPRVVADVGAGTGKLTRLLAARGWQVTAVEPDAGMRELLVATAPEVTVVEGRGESIPLPNGSVDLLTYAQSWHWVDPVAGMTEAARVLRSGGVLALIWNVSGQDDVLAAADRLTGAGSGAADMVDWVRTSFAPAGFDVLPLMQSPWSEELSRADYRARITTYSAMATRPEAERARIVAEVDELLDTSAETVGLDPLHVPHVTIVAGFRKH